LAFAKIRGNRGKDDKMFNKVLVSFLLPEQIPDITSLQRKRLILVHNQFWRFQSSPIGPVILGLWQERMAEQNYADCGTAVSKSLQRHAPN
jgi:hypothetical protein